MTRRPFSRALRALAAGAVCLAILSGMIVAHAWPLLSGTVVVLRVQSTGAIRSQYVHFDMPAERLIVTGAAVRDAQRELGVQPLGDSFRNLPEDRWQQQRRFRGMTVYVQLEPVGDGAEHQAVSVSDRPIDGALDLRGRVQGVDNGRLNVNYGVGTYHMTERATRDMEAAIAARKPLQIEVAIAASGRARIRNVLIDGVPLQK